MKGEKVQKKKNLRSDLSWTNKIYCLEAAVL